MKTSLLSREKQKYIMEFAMKTLVVLALLTIATVVIVVFIQTWTGRSINIAESVYDFFSNLVGIG